jgi:hypothetical protein
VGGSHVVRLSRYGINDLDFLRWIRYDAACVVGNSLIEAIGMPDEWRVLYIQARLTAPRSIEYIC